MELTVADRLHLLAVLPAEGSLTTLRIVRELGSALSFSEEEHQALAITNEKDPEGKETGRVTWNTAAATTKAVAIGPKAKDVLLSAIGRVSAQERLPMEFLGLYERLEAHNGATDAA